MNTYKKLNQHTTHLIITGNTFNGVVIVDTEDVDKLKKHSWYIAHPTFMYKKDLSKCKSNLQYVRAKINGKTGRIHRLLLNAKPKDIIDHIDHNPLNNKKSNLTISNHSKNGLNSRISSNNVSGYNGVYCKSNKIWVACIKINYKTYTKTFSIAKYGSKEAKNKAIQARKELEKLYI